MTKAKSPDSNAQGDLFKAETSWFHLFRTMIDSGDAGEMGGTAFLVYAVVKSHTNFVTGQSFPSIETIAKKAKISERQVMRELQTLEHMGYLTKQKVGRNNIYTLREKVEIMDADTGRPAAVATWDYLPGTVKAAVADLKNVVMQGDLNGAKIVHIENLHVEIKQFVQGTGFQFNEADIASLPADIRDKMISLREDIRRRAESKG